MTWPISATLWNIKSSLFNPYPTTIVEVFAYPLVRVAK